MNLMPAEQVIYLAVIEHYLGTDDEWMLDRMEEYDTDDLDFDIVRHAWIVAAEALEERAIECENASVSYSDRGIVILSDKYGYLCLELRTAARALRKAAREEVC